MDARGDIAVDANRAISPEYLTTSDLTMDMYEFGGTVRRFSLYFLKI